MLTFNFLKFTIENLDIKGLNGISNVQILTGFLWRGKGGGELQRDDVILSNFWCFL